MLDYYIRRKLESLHRLPTIPYVITEVLQAIDNEKTRVNQLADLIEQDQALTARVLRVANSPFYGFSRRISTIELAVVLIGTNSIKEIVMSLILQRFFSKARNDLLDIKRFWHYSLFCGACCRLLARKMGYRLSGEAFVAGVMHDIGLLILSDNFTSQFAQIRTIQKALDFSIKDAEKTVLSCTHADIGAWLAEKWNLPSQLCNAILFHHTPYNEVLDFFEKIEYKRNDNIAKKNGSILQNNDNIDMPLTHLVAMSEWFARDLGFMEWAEENVQSPLFISSKFFDQITQNDVLNSENSLKILKQEILEEYDKASILTELSDKSF